MDTNYLVIGKLALDKFSTNNISTLFLMNFGLPI